MEPPGERDRGEASDRAELERWDNDTKREMAGYVDELEAIVPPQELQPEAAEFLAFVGESVKLWGDYLDASRKGTPDDVEAALAAGSRNAKRVNKLVAALHIPDCATSDSYTAYGWQPMP